jgi:nucleotide-binding universal stress UspA family protein
MSRDMFENVIVGVDRPQAGRDALRLAQLLTSRGAQLTLAYVEVVAPRPGPSAAAVSEAAHARRALRRLAQLRDESQVDAHVLCVEAGSVPEGLHELALRRRADLLVVGASRRDDLVRPYIEDETRAVFENAPCPVGVAPAAYATRASRLDKVGAAYDGSPESEEAVAVARELARERGAALSAFEAVGEPAYVHSIVNPQPEIEESLAQARERIAGLGDVEPHAASSDDVPEALARYGASVDLLVVGSHRYRPIDHLLSGSTAQRLADTAPCPLLVLSRPRPDPQGESDA